MLRDDRSSGCVRVEHPFASLVSDRLHLEDISTLREIVIMFSSTCDIDSDSGVHKRNELVTEV